MGWGKNSSTCHFCGYHESRRDECSQMGGDVEFSDEEGESNGEGEKEGMGEETGEEKGKREN